MIHQNNGGQSFRQQRTLGSEDNKMLRWGAGEAALWCRSLSRQAEINTSVSISDCPADNLMPSSTVDQTISGLSTGLEMLTAGA